VNLATEYERLLAEVGAEWKAYIGGMLDFAKEHRDLIARFGRFPHRNRVMGRTPTAEEQQFLSEGATSYGQRLAFY
jgi:uncharacterized protein (DUF924 family)